MKDSPEIKTLLLVEDEPLTAKVETKQLEQYGYAVIHQSSGEKAVDFMSLSPGSIDLVLMDIDLGEGMDGTQTAEQILAYHNMPVVFLSSHTESEIVERTEKITSYGYVVKNSGITVLDASIKMAFRLFEQKQRVKQHEQELATANEEMEQANEELLQTNEELEQSQQEILQREADLQESEQRFRNLFQSMNDGVAVYEAVEQGQDFVFKDINQAAESIEKIDREEVIGKSVCEFFPGIKEFGLFDIFQQVWRTGEPKMHPVSQYQDNRIVGWRENYVYKLSSGEIVAIYQDITERKQAEEALRHAKKMYQNLFMNAQVGLFRSERHSGHILEANEVLAHFVGYSSRTELLADNYCIANHYLYPEDRRRFLEELSHKGEVSWFEAPFRRLDGSVFWLKVSARLAEDGQYIDGVSEDVTAERQAKDALLYEKEMNRRVMDVNPVAMVVLDQEGRITYANERARQMLGIELSPEDGLTYNHPEWRITDFAGNPFPDRELPFAVVQRERRSVYGVEHAIQMSGRQRVLLSINAAPLFDFNEEFAGMVASLEDMTERVRLAELKQSHLSLIRYAENSTILELLQRFLDEAEKLTGSEVGFYHFLESDQETLALQTWSTNTLANMCQAEGGGSHYPVSEAGVWVDAIHERRPVIHNDYPSLNHKKGLPEGHAPVARELVVPVFRQNRIVAILGVGNKHTYYGEHDISIVQYLADFAWETVDRKRAEEALRQSEERYRSILNSMADGVVLHNSSGQIIEVNPAACAILGLSKEQLLGQDSYEIQDGAVREDGSPFPAEEHPALRTLADGEAVRGVIIGLTHPDLRKSWLNINSSPLFDGGENSPSAAIVTFSDITARKETEHALQKAYQEKQALLRELQHRAKNSFNVLYNIVFLKSRTTDREREQQLLNDISARIKSMAELYTLLYESDSLNWVSLDHYLAKVVESSRSMAGNVEIQTDLEKFSLSAKNAANIGLVVTELVTNAFKYAFPKNEKGKIAITLKRRNGGAIVTISDNGVGLPQDFDIEDLPSMGLGLVKSIVKQLGGKLEFESGQGTTWRFYIEEQDEAVSSDNS